MVVTFTFCLNLFLVHLVRYEGVKLLYCIIQYIYFAELKYWEAIYKKMKALRIYVIDKIKGPIGRE